MAKPVFIDANIPMYAAGESHPHKEPSLELLERVAAGHLKAVTDSEVLQEILYRFWSLKLLPKALEVFDHFLLAVPAVLPVTKRDLVRAKTILVQESGLPPRDAVHAAVLLNNGLKSVCSYDRHFDRISGIHRIEP